MYKIMKIRYKTMYHCTNRPDLLKNSNSLKVQNHENSMEKSKNIPNLENSMKNCVHYLYRESDLL